MTGCLTCTSSSVCTTCDTTKNYTLNGSTCATCSSVLTGCLACSNSTTCTTCDTNNNFQISGKVCTCVTYYVLSGSTCVTCASAMAGCLTCTSSSVCTTCDATKNYTLNGSVCVTPGGNLDFSTLNVNVPLGGCSSPIVITPTASTSNDITLNTSAWTALGYYLESPVTFNSTLTAQSITICSNATATANPTLSVVLSGTDADLYTINNAGTANIQITTTAAPTPVISTPTVSSSTSNTTTLSIESNR
jgi:hypothetical protein